MWYLIAILILLIPLLAVVLDSQLGRALASRIEKSPLGEPENLQSERLAFLEGEVDRLDSELQRLSEESQFLHRLLTEGDGASSGKPPVAPPEGEPPA